jgi:UDP-N-acetylmuramate: L-alanyl-gamma-D-glutamyl-meso-diaminopimelate ligase
MHIHVLGICGTFMAGLAAIARASGHRVTGSDRGVYPPMSDQLAAQGIDIIEGYEADQLSLNPDVVVVGNVMTRGMPVIEEMLNRRMAYMSGPEWLAQAVLRKNRVIGVAGTHGKTTTSSLLAWILERAGLEPGFLIGGVPRDFDVSARAGAGSVFVIEADEYDSAFFDKRAKFLHYRPEIQVITNLEFDHADIYADLAAIQWQFHQLIRALPGNGRLIVRADDENLRQVLDMGCWTPVETFASREAAGRVEAGWLASAATPGEFSVFQKDAERGRCDWNLTGAYNAENALAALLAALQLGVSVEQSLEAIGEFRGVKRRLELRGTYGGIALYDDFAHHPTAISRTIAGLRAESGIGRLLIVLEPRSNTMKLGVHRDTLADALRDADQAWVFDSTDQQWDLAGAMSGLSTATVCDDIDTIVNGVAAYARPDDRLVVMSNGGFCNIHETLAQALDRKSAKTG